MQYTVSRAVPYRRQHIQGKFLGLSALSLASSAFCVWGTSSHRGGPNISESNCPGGPIILGDPSLCDMIGEMRKKFKIFQNTLPVSLIKFPLDCDKPNCTIDRILIVTAALTNLCPSVVPRSFIFWTLFNYCL